MRGERDPGNEVVGFNGKQIFYVCKNLNDENKHITMASRLKKTNLHHSRIIRHIGRSGSYDTGQFLQLSVDLIWVSNIKDVS